MSTTWRDPSGRAPYPRILIAGSDKSGKSAEIVRLAGSGLVGKVWWIVFGERSPDEYARFLPGLQNPDGSWRFQIVEPTNRQELRTVVRDIVKRPRTVANLPDAIALDNATPLWELVSAEAQEKANLRAARKAKKDPEWVEDGDVNTDLWNNARDHWYEILGPLLAYRDIVLITGRLDDVAVMKGGSPDPSGKRMWKVAAQKRLGADVDATIQLRGHHPASRHLTGVRSVALAIAAREKGQEYTPAVVNDRADGWGVVDLIRELGVTEANVDARPVNLPVTEQESALPPDWRERLDAAEQGGDVDRITAMYRAAEAAGASTAMARIRAAGTRARAAQQAPTATPEATPQDPDTAVPPNTGTATGTLRVAAQATGHTPAPMVSHNQLHESTRQAVKDWAADRFNGAPASEPTPEDEPPPDPEPQSAPAQWTAADKRERATWRRTFDAHVADGTLRAIEAGIRTARKKGWDDLAEQGQTDLDNLRALAGEEGAA